MAKITIEGKEHTCSQIIKEEIEWLDTRITTAITLARMIEDKQEEIDEFMLEKKAEIQDIVNQLKDI